MQSETARPSTKAVAKAQPNAVALAPQWGQGGMGVGVSAEDVLIPKLLIMQQMSKLVVDEQAKSGEIIRSTTSEVLGGRGKPVRFIPLICNKVWAIFEMEGKSPKFRGIEPFTDPTLPWEFTDGAKRMRRDQTLNLYALLPGDVEREEAAIDKMAKTGELNPNDALLPVLIQFRRTGFSAGKQVVTHFAKAGNFGKPAAISVLELDSEKIEGEQGTYFVPTVKYGGPTPAAFLRDGGPANKWFDIIAKSGASLKVDDSDLAEPEEKPVGAAPLGRSEF